MTGFFEQFSAGLEQFLEQDARQRRYVMEADETNPKTRERTEGAAIVVQAMRGDSCTTAKKVQDGPKISITFGVEANLPISLAGKTFWSRTALRRPSRVSRPWRCAQQQLPVAEFPQVKPPQQRRPISTSHLFGFDRPRRRIWRRFVRRLQLHTSRTTAAASGDCLLLPTVGGSLRLNPGKIELLIQAVRKVTYSPAHFWDRDARWFVVRSYGLGQLVTSCSV